jgi:hypothetical protein
MVASGTRKSYSLLQIFLHFEECNRLLYTHPAASWVNVVCAHMMRTSVRNDLSKVMKLHSVTSVFLIMKHATGVLKW